eukprot:SAG11_NODE_7010_length_1209_cov_0.781982_1_plen_127_part_10
MISGGVSIPAAAWSPAAREAGLPLNFLETSLFELGLGHDLGSLPDNGNNVHNGNFGLDPSTGAWMGTVCEQRTHRKMQLFCTRRPRRSACHNISQSQNLIRSQATDCEKGKKLFLSGTAVPQPDRFR